MVTKITEAEFNQQNEGLVLVDFYADWCGPCKMISPIIEDLSKKISYATFYKVDVDQERKFASNFQVQSIPTLVLFKNGLLVDKKVGFMSKDAIVKWLENHR